MRKKILYYSDCPFFAGCENVIKNLISSKKLNNEYEVHFLFRKSDRYLSDLKKINFKYRIKEMPIKLLSFDDIYFKFLDNKNLLVLLKKLSLKIIEFILSPLNYWIGMFYLIEIKKTSEK